MLECGPGIYRDLFLVNIFLVYLNQPPKFPAFPVANFIWKSKVPLKVMSFVWTLAFGRINTNAMLQKGRLSVVISGYPPDICLLCRTSYTNTNNESFSHGFLDWEMTSYLWRRLLAIYEES